ncbi:MAG: hypothetical protein IKX33_11145 [Prevotella sp.]|nr:hypothetical protein [Prevotella sp.]
MKRILLTIVCAVALSLGAWAQVDEVVAKINKDGVWQPRAYYLKNMEKADDFIAQVYDSNEGRLKYVLYEIEEDHVWAQKILQTKKDILGKTKKKKKQNKKLAKFFNDVEQARQSFAQAEETEKCYAHLTKVLNGFIDNGVSHSMPSGALKSFYFSSGNGFAGFYEEFSLMKKDGKNILGIKSVKRMHIPEDKGEVERQIEVDDSVLQRVRDMVEEGMLYDVSREYSPEMMITDATSWSMSIYFEGGSINSSGYAAGPDHSDTLNSILKYLSELAGIEE